MKAIVISEQKFNELFDDTTIKLELQALQQRVTTPDILDQATINELVRIFRFEVFKLKDRLIREAM